MAYIAELRNRDRQLGEELDALKRKILNITKRTTADAFTLGEHFEQAALRLRRRYQAWVQTECGIDVTTARNYRRMYNVLKEHKDILAGKRIAPTVLVRLSSKKEIIGPVVEAIAKGARFREKDLADFERSSVVRDDKDQLKTGKRRPLPSNAVKAIAKTASSVEQQAYDLLHLVDHEESIDQDVVAGGMKLASRIDALATFLGDQEANRWKRVADLIRTAIQGRSSEQRRFKYLPAGQRAFERIAKFSDSTVVEPAGLGSGLLVTPSSGLTNFELCAGAGGLALGMKKAGFEHVGMVERNLDACNTLRANFPGVAVHQADIAEMLDLDVGHIDVLSGGPPCQPFSVASADRIGPYDERNLFPVCLELIKKWRPRAVILENVAGVMEKKNTGFRASILSDLEREGYASAWEILTATSFGVAQKRRRSFLIAFDNPEAMARFRWPQPLPRYVHQPSSVASVLAPLLKEKGWAPPAGFLAKLCDPAPTLIGGSDKKGGADLGQVAARDWWSERDVDPTKIAMESPEPGKQTPIPLSLAMLAALQDFPPNWKFCGKKVPVFQQITNAVPPTLGAFVGAAVRLALTGEDLTPDQVINPFGSRVAWWLDDYDPNRSEDDDRSERIAAEWGELA